MEDEMDNQTNRVTEIANFLNKKASDASQNTLMMFVWIEEIQQATGLQNISYLDLESSAKLTKSDTFDITFRFPDEVSDGQCYIYISPKELPAGVTEVSLDNGVTLLRSV